MKIAIVFLFFALALHGSHHNPRNPSWGRIYTAVNCLNVIVDSPGFPQKQEGPQTSPHNAQQDSNKDNVTVHTTK